MTAIEHALHRRLAAGLFNEVWTLLECPNRTAVEDDAMVHAAHASRYHWGAVGGPENWAIGEWQISRVYATLGCAEPALHHARRGLELCAEHRLADFVLAYAHEAMARACALAGDSTGRDLHAAAARKIPVTEEDTQARLETDLQQIG